MEWEMEKATYLAHNLRKFRSAHAMGLERCLEICNLLHNKFILRGFSMEN